MALCLYLKKLDIPLCVSFVPTEVPATLVHFGEYLVAAKCHYEERGRQQPQRLPPLHRLVTCREDTVSQSNCSVLSIYIRDI